MTPAAGKTSRTVRRGTWPAPGGGHTGQGALTPAGPDSLPRAGSAGPGLRETLPPRPPGAGRRCPQPQTRPDPSTQHPQTGCTPRGGNLSQAGLHREIRAPEAGRGAGNRANCTARGRNSTQPREDLHWEPPRNQHVLSSVSSLKTEDVTLQRATHAHVQSGVSDVTASRKQPECPSADKQTEEESGLSAVEYYAATKKGRWGRL